MYFVDKSDDYLTYPHPDTSRLQHDLTSTTPLQVCRILPSDRRASRENQTRSGL